LGCPVLQYLAAAGIGTLGIIDFDIVSESNLQRQVLFGSSSLGINKAIAAKKRLEDLNTSISIHAYPKKLNHKNAISFFKEYDIIVDGTDNFKTRYLVSDACIITKKPLVYAGIYKFEGQVSVFNYKNGSGLLRMTSANISTQYQINNNTFKRGQSEAQIEESTSGGGRSDDLFGVSQDFSDSRQNQEDEEAEEEIDLTNYIYKMPWSLNLAYSLTYNNAVGQNDFSTNSLMISSNLSLTPKWTVGISSGYDFKQKGFTYTQLRFDRDLDSWKLDFSWVPFSPRASWNFFIGIKSGLLSDLKYEKKSEPDRS